MCWACCKLVQEARQSSKQNCVTHYLHQKAKKTGNCLRSQVAYFNLNSSPLQASTNEHYHLPLRDSTAKRVTKPSDPQKAIVRGCLYRININRCTTSKDQQRSNLAGDIKDWYNTWITTSFVNSYPSCGSAMILKSTCDGRMD